MLAYGTHAPKEDDWGDRALLWPPPEAGAPTPWAVASTA